MKKKVYFRADGNERIGHGHVMRALAFAEMIKEFFSPIFIIQLPTKSLKESILSTCEDIIELPSLELIEESQYLSNYIATNDILVLDGYHFTSIYQKQLHVMGVKLVYIDDLASSHQYANAIVNHSAGFTPQNYSTEFYTRFYLGPEYALLRKPFTDAARALSNKEKPESLFINMGGADPINFTLSAIEVALKQNIFNKINVVLGSSYKFLDTLEVFKSNPGIVFHTNLSAEQMVELMQQCEVAICSSSTIAYEYCSVGGTLFVAKTADNQKHLYEFLLKEKLAIDVSEFSKVSSISIQNQISIQRQYFDGKSPLRLQRLITNLKNEDEILVRKAEAKDMLTLYEWANDPEARGNSINKEPIPISSHEKWFYAKIADENSFVFINSLNGENIGQVRFDYKNNYWLISFAVDKSFRRQGLGEIMLSKSIEKLIKTISSPVIFKAQVMEANKASENIFFKLGFEKKEFEILNNDKFYNYYKTFNK